MRPVFQILALALSLAMLGFLACHAQKRSASVTNNAATPSDAAAPPVYLPASKSGAVFVEPQQQRQAPR